jgi:hypothetical protein
MEVYKRETEEILRRFKNGRLSFQGCIAALDAALAGVVPVLRPDQIQLLREIVLARNAEVMAEMEKRGQRVREKSSSAV